MKKLLSLKKFQKENQDSVLEKEVLAEVNGGIGGGPSSLSHEDRPTLDSWNCCDSVFSDFVCPIHLPILNQK